ncbi:thiamine pyrophosphate-dependent enzyme [Flavobacteriaceae bacterium]|nr:thiamine pyrophosphate-dependent enzyme [Flavobacteriaceae bacterium]
MKLSKLKSKPNIEKDQAIRLLEAMLEPRLIEEKMLKLLRQGKVSKWFSGMGQEAIAAGLTQALNVDDYILPMHRNLGVFTGRNIDLVKLFAQFQGKTEGFTLGRDRSFHFGANQHHILGMISHLGPQMGVACGIALAEKINKTGKIAAVFTGEGGSSEGDFHEALNIASTWDLPVLFVIENNGYGLSTPTSEQYNCRNLADRGLGYGMESHTIDGNNIIEVYNSIKTFSAQIRQNSKPILVEFKTFRIRGHEEASGQDYIPKELIEHWKEKDPIEAYIDYLYKNKYLSKNQLVSISDFYKDKIDIAWKKANSLEEINEVSRVSESEVFKNEKLNVIHRSSQDQARELRFIDAISEGLSQSFDKFPDLVMMGQDIAEYGGAFKVSKGFVEKFGKNRIINTPICESAVIEVAYGLGVKGIKSIVELQFADFVSSGFNPIVNLVAKSFYRWKQQAPIVFRMPCGAGVGAGPFHSQSNESWFLHTPGLKIIYPAFPDDAKGLLATSIRDENPVLFFEHKLLYRKVRGLVDSNYYEIPLGKANIVAGGNQITVITYGLGVHWVLEIMDKFKEHTIELIDLRSLMPLDYECMTSSIKKTGKALVLNEANEFLSLSAEIASKLSEENFEYLDAPIMRLGSDNTPIPFNKNLESNYLASSRLEEKIKHLLAY